MSDQHNDAESLTSAAKAPAQSARDLNGYRARRQSMTPVIRTESAISRSAWRLDKVPLWRNLSTCRAKVSSE